jgi:hypothetical protein
MSAGARLRNEQGTDTEQILLLSELSAASTLIFIARAKAGAKLIIAQLKLHSVLLYTNNILF